MLVGIILGSAIWLLYFAMGPSYRSFFGWYREKGNYDNALHVEVLLLVQSTVMLLMHLSQICQNFEYVSLLSIMKYEDKLSIEEITYNNQTRETQ